MPWPKGRGKVPGSGRKKGSINKTTLMAIEIAQKHDFNPFEMLMHFARGDEKALGWDHPMCKVLPNGTIVEIDRITPLMRLQAIIEACSYLHAKMKSIELSENPDKPVGATLVDLVKQIDVKPE